MQLFDTDNVVNRNAVEYIFTTEGHVIHLDPSYRVKLWERDEPETTNGYSCREKLGGALSRTNDTFIGHSVSIFVVLQHCSVVVPSSATQQQQQQQQ